MLGEFIEASINFTTEDVFVMYGLFVVFFYGIALIMYKSASSKDS
jgi:preprotein translocase subunit SecE